jgi:hypothetical protein
MLDVKKLLHFIKNGHCYIYCSVMNVITATIHQWNRNTYINVHCTKVHVDLTFAKHLLTAVMSKLHAAEGAGGGGEGFRCAVSRFFYCKIHLQ